MIRVLLAEWREWKRPGAVRAAAALVLAASGLLVVTGLHPGALAEVLVAASLLGGWISGTQVWNKVKSWDWLGDHGVKAPAYVLGKLLGFLAALLVLLVPAVPLVLLVTLRWGIPWDFLLVVLAWCLATGAAAQLLTHLLSFSTSEFGRLLATALVAGWIILGFQFPDVGRWNPLLQVWLLNQSVNLAAAWFHWALLSGACLLLYGLVTAVVSYRGGRS